MGLEFEDDAIVLSGETGTKLKSEIIGQYYPLWWNITSGGEDRAFANRTAIIELNAGTGLDYIKDTKETILGSSGHAIQLKANDPNAKNLRLILVENDSQCYPRLKKVMRRRWPSIKWSERPLSDRDRDVYLVNAGLPTAVDIIQEIVLGNSLFFFDPLLFTPWSEIDRVARKRIDSYYQIGTEFIVFLFTSDWFLGRSTIGLTPLPTRNDEKWSSDEADSVSQCDELLGHRDWRRTLLTGDHMEIRVRRLVELYRVRLHTWFRYVVPMPFEPKKNQRYHLFMCSNYEVGASITKRFYSEYTKNLRYSPINAAAYKKFIQLHQDKKKPGNARSSEWKMLWAIIRDHEEGYCDVECSDLRKIEPEPQRRRGVLEWLASKNYLQRIPFLTAEWPGSRPEVFYKLDGAVVNGRLCVNPPPKLIPLSPKTGKPVLAVLFDDGYQVRLEEGSSLGGLTDEEGRLDNMDQMLAEIKCRQCETIMPIQLPEIQDIAGDEKEMGTETWYSAKWEGKCKTCGNPMEIDIELTTYAYNTDFHNYECEGCDLV